MYLYQLNSAHGGLRTFSGFLLTYYNYIITENHQEYRSGSNNSRGGSPVKEIPPQSTTHISSPSLSNQISSSNQVQVAVRSGSSSGSNSGQQPSKMLSSPHHKDSANNVIAVAKSDLNIVSVQ